VADAAAPAATDQPSPCTHPDFDIVVDVNRIEPDPDTGMPCAFTADIHINCKPAPEGCGIAFTFPGLPCGLSYIEPRCSVDGTELRAPIRPVGAPDDFGAGLPSFGVHMYVAGKPAR
jgi:hypothetical protein